MEQIQENRAIGAFIGLAIGDAYGRPLEFISGLRVRQQKVSTDTNDFMWTDDTHMSLYLADALLSIGGQSFSPERVGKAIGKQFSLWYEDPLMPSTAPGNTCLAGVKNYISSQNWKTSGIQSSDGCGAVMRLCPLPFVYQGEELDVAAAISAQITHAHPNAIAGTVAGARLLRSILITGDITSEMVLEAASDIEISHPDGTDIPAALRAAVVHSQQENIEWLDENFIPTGDGGWRTPSALGLSLAAALIWKSNPALAIEKAARINGDSDSVACLTGMFLGAALGVEALPAAWVAALPMKNDIQKKALKLLAVQEQNSQPSLADQLRSLVVAGVGVSSDPDKLRNAIVFTLGYGHPVGEKFEAIALDLGISVQHGASDKSMAIDRSLVPADVRRVISGEGTGSTRTIESFSPFDSHSQATVIEDVEEINFSQESIIDADVIDGHISSKSHCRTSISHPVSVDWVLQNVSPSGGWLGITFAPGKKASSTLGKPWSRDLELDLARLKGLYGVDALISLVEDKELDLLEIPDLIKAAASYRIPVFRFPIVDMSIPKIEDALRAVDITLALAKAGSRVVFHCRGGLGRAGTLMACTLVSLGEHPQKAIEQTRHHREGAIENQAQEDFVHRFARALKQ